MKLVLLLALGFLLLLCSISDGRRKMIPNVAVLLILLLGIFNSLLDHSLSTSLAGIIIPSAPLLIAKFRYHFFIGTGDIKLLSSIGAWVGWFLNLYVLLMACVISLIYVGLNRLIFRKKLVSVPFAPFISISTLLAIILKPFLFT